MTDKDDDIRERLLDHFESRPEPGSVEYLRNIVLSVPGVKEARIRELSVPNKPLGLGTIEVQVADVDWEAPDDLRAAVTVALTPWMPLTIQFQVVRLYDDPSVEKPVTPRESVRRFAVDMEKRLQANDHKKGWDDCSYLYLLDRLHEEHQELCAAYQPFWDAMVKADHFSARNRRLINRVIEEAADVANFAMMIASKARACLPKPFSTKEFEELLAADGSVEFSEEIDIEKLIRLGADERLEEAKIDAVPLILSHVDLAARQKKPPMKHPPRYDEVYWQGVAALDDMDTEVPPVQDDPNFGHCVRCYKEAVLSPDAYCPVCEKIDKCTTCDGKGWVESDRPCARCGEVGCESDPCPGCGGRP